MTRPEPLDPGKGKAWVSTCRELIHKLEDRAPAGYDGTLLAPYRAQQSSPVAPDGRVYSTAALDLIARPFTFAGGRIVLVKLTRVAFVGLLRAMREVPTIEVGFGGGYFATWRSWAMQAGLYAAYQAGGALAAPPGRSWHHRASVDLGDRGPAIRPGDNATEEGRLAMIGAGFVDLLPQDPPHFTYGRRG